MSVANLGGFMTMTFLGYYDKVEQSYPQIKDTTRILRYKNFSAIFKVLCSQAGLKEERVSLELILVKLSHKKRKESADPMVQVC